MFTSNFATVKKLPAHLKPVAISIGVPKWWNGPVERRLAPTWQMLKMDRKDYDRLFKQRLARLNARELYESLGENAVLLCYEAHNDWCHRRLVAEWFEQELGIVVPEWGFDREDTFPYDECCKARKGTLRRDELKKLQEQQKQQQEPEAVRLRRQAMEAEKERQLSLFDVKSWE
jgi:hypothetical protein